MADPSAVIAADLALSREARSRGEAEALRRAAADEALVLAPKPLPADRWLKGRSTAAPPREWEPHTVWASCDGGFAVTGGAWRQGSASGEYVALWQRQAKGGWRWLLHEDGPAGSPGAEPDMISGNVAECAGLPRRPPGFTPSAPDPLGDASRDGSLEWAAVLTPRCGLTVAAKAWNGKAMTEVLTWTRPEPPQGCG